jgi:hypothetical protein
MPSILSRALAAACVLMGALTVCASRAYSIAAVDQPHLKRTLVRLTNSANAIIVEPITPDPKRARFAVLLTHPDHVNTFNYFIGEELAARGYRVMMMNYYGPEIVYEEFLAPLAAAVKHLRGIPGVQRVVMAGHSTGGAVLTFYQDVAENGPKACQGPERVYPCPGKNFENLPPADGVMILDSSAGALERLIALDPSMNGRHPRARDPALDMFEPRNGFDPQTKSGSYGADFVRLYLAGQSARQMNLIDEASRRLAKIDGGQGDFKDDEPFVVPGSSVHAYDGARLDLADLQLLSKTRAPHPLLKADGSMPTQIIHSTRPPLALADAMDRMSQTAQDVTVRHFLSFLALRTTVDYKVSEDDVRGVEWRSVANSVPGNMRGIRVPSLFMSATCAPHLVFTEIAYQQSSAKDKEFLGVEGADHEFRPCKPEYGDPTKHAFDYVDGWLQNPSRF